MEIYKDYLSTIKSAMNNDPRANKGSYLNFNGSKDELEKGLKNFLLESKENIPLPSLRTFASDLGLTPNYSQGLGSHPDFSHLKHSENIEKHFILSMFIDIKGSTNLFKRYSPETVLVITNTIQRAAIHTCLIFGGYVHRLQGDGLFVYFGGKQIEQRKAVEQALNASSVFTYFVKNDLKELFNEQGVETIFTRIGMDLGENEDVVWAMAGMGEISEITTCSLHTSLASKMQGFSASNGVVVGDNIKKYMNDEFLNAVSKRTGKETDRYIFQIPQENFNYTQYDFSWEPYLKQLDFVVTDLNGNLSMKHSRVSRIPEQIKPIAEKSIPYYHFL